MHCAACAQRIEKALDRVPGVENASVNLVDRARDRPPRPRDRAAERLVAAIREAGYDVANPSRRHAQRPRPWRPGPDAALDRDRAHGAGRHPRHGARPIPGPRSSRRGWIQLVLSAPVVFWCGASVLPRRLGRREARRRRHEHARRRRHRRRRSSAPRSRRSRRGLLAAARGGPRRRLLRVGRRHRHPDPPRPSARSPRPRPRGEAITALLRSSRPTRARVLAGRRRGRGPRSRTSSSGDPHRRPARRADPGRRRASRKARPRSTNRCSPARASPSKRHPATPSSAAR